jgi:hypothetical protein
MADYGVILNRSLIWHGEEEGGEAQGAIEKLAGMSSTSTSTSPSTPPFPMAADGGLAEFYAATTAAVGEDRLFLELRYYARHFIPIFCCVGIVGAKHVRKVQSRLNT